MNDARTIRISLPDLFDFKECLWFLDRNFDDCMHRVADEAATRAISIEGQQFVIRVAQRQRVLQVTLLEGVSTPASKALIRDYVIHWLDLDKDIAPFYQLLQKDERLAYMCTGFKGLRLIAIPDLFEAICWSIIGQQINLTFAYKLKRRLTEAFGTAILHEDTPYWLFPEPAVLAGAEKEVLRSMQFSEKKAEYVIGIAQAFAGQKLSKELITALPDLAQKQKILTSFRGIGIWTANYALMKSLKDPLCIPHGDVGLLKALVNHGIIKERNDTAAIDRFFKKFRGWESYLVFYLWRSLAPR